MRRPIALKALLALLLPPAAMHAAEPGIASLSWLGGCWAAESGEPGSGEQWMPLAGGTLLGTSRTIRGGRTVAHEFLQIREDAEGRIAYIALPSRQQETAFLVTDIAEEAVTFENPDHDFPQRVSYRLLPEGRLLARIEGTRNGTPRGVDFPMRKVPCEAMAKSTAK